VTANRLEPCCGLMWDFLPEKPSDKILSINSQVGKSYDYLPYQVNPLANVSFDPSVGYDHLPSPFPYLPPLVNSITEQ
jgi:hypothetical protein